MMSSIMGLDLFIAIPLAIGFTRGSNQFVQIRLKTVIFWCLDLFFSTSFMPWIMGWLGIMWAYVGVFGLVSC